jgi:cell division protein FtsB
MRNLSRIAIPGLLALTLSSTAVRADEGAGRITGVVLDGSRKAIANMTVRATDVVDPSRMYTTLSDRDGKFAAGDIAAGSYLVSADTVNTTWIQKDDSPIVEVSSKNTPDTTLVLVKVAEMMSASSGDGSGITGLEIATLGVASFAAIAAGVNLAATNDLESDNAQLKRGQQELQDQVDMLEEDIAQLNFDLHNRASQLEQQIAALEQDLAALGGQNEELQRQIAALQRDLDQIQQDINDLLASPR